ncbi:MAG: NAD(P)-dependent oxidoreductase [Alphaproteobacteria bacterium]|nr:MAG: NAD(P)-dependent oxidoreductase [Alphaproteobacteria bacterium]
MTSSTLKLGIIGGLGTMASPSARHWTTPDSTVRVLRVHDRGTPGTMRDAARAAWKNHGAMLVSSYTTLVGPAEIDGVIICCGKNGEDANIVAQVATLLAERAKGKFICHLSTVSTCFAKSAQEFCAELGVTYVNYPLTGGSKGAESAKMLILASGDEKLFARLSPALSRIGVPQYFGERAEAGAEVKFMSHLMVFGGLVGITSAVAVHTDCFAGGKIGAAGQGEFFDFLNNGAGGTKQWDLSTSLGVKQNTWEAAWAIKYAVIDAVYAVNLCLQRGTSRLAVDSVLRLILAFSYVLNKVGENFATQSIVREMIASRAAEMDQFIAQYYDSKLPAEKILASCITSLPKNLQSQIALGLTARDFENAAAQKIGKAS